jgi:dicarboxylate transporter 10
MLHSFHGLYHIVADEGARGLFRGLAPNCARAVIMNASQLASYDSIKSGLMSTGHFKDDMLTYLLSSTAAGTIATTACAPFDVVKSRMMNASEKQGVRAQLAACGAYVETSPYRSSRSSTPPSAPRAPGGS